VPSLTVIVLEFDLLIFNPMQILFINIIKHVCQGTRSNETTDGLLKKMGGRKSTKPGYEYMTSTLGFDFHSLHFVN
jgi:hypothetical protein